MKFKLLMIGHTLKVTFPLWISKFIKKKIGLIVGLVHKFWLIRTNKYTG